MEHRHRAAMEADPRSFFRREGELEQYVKVAHASSDMLVWQSSQGRDEATASLLNTTLPTRPQSEVYDSHSSLAMANTSRLATSPFIAARHEAAHLRRLRFEVNDPLSGTLQRPNTTSTGLLRASGRRAVASSSSSSFMAGTGSRAASSLKVWV